MPDELRPTPKIRARGRSFLALVLSPEPVLADWLAGLDAQIARSSTFFAGKPVILDLSLLDAATEGLADLYPALCARGIRIIGIEGGDAAWPACAGWDWPSGFMGGRASGAVDIPDDAAPAQPQPPRGSSMIIEQPIRSGQVIMNPDGDVIVIGSVGSGAEVTAGGSIHVYGPLRGRAIAGMNGQPDARIFAHSMQAELLAIDGYYITAEEIDPQYVEKPAQIVLTNDTLVVQPLVPPAFPVRKR
ncbi:septum site-determining protein MinC [Komagataeibacter swingsii]|uniref:Probable septum site-determining protein MinC n=1 Tax=Komagataeibacter swingsii TaxID=215220 RepID=A0A850NST2_9PROT|nr:septum site-determining protein MinC [Komagataeibacter swingsii]AHI24378.1 septum formation inhibitor [Komagataeibacter xylinus E25]NVN35485.1 septum site-determining protein MinC [Komagataeibacter swingsii]RFP04829.1 septum formation inhibitor MinC [Komagataeibacter xylinus]RFP07314.1 septum formation inhibitor MinC [Komagataeibacter xylinus]